MKTIEVSDYLYSILEEEASRRKEEGWKEGATPDRVAAEGIAFYFGYDLVGSFKNLDEKMDAFRDRPPEDIDDELRWGIEDMEESNMEYERSVGIA